MPGLSDTLNQTTEATQGVTEGNNAIATADEARQGLEPGRKGTQNPTTTTTSDDDDDDDEDKQIKKDKGKPSSLKITINLNLDVEVHLTARVKGDITIGLL